MNGFTEPLLKTKLYLPVNRQPVVKRPRLIERISTGAQRSLTLISAPAGFGKTIALVEWARQSPAPVAWVSLDSGDNDPALFLSYLIAALDQALPEGSASFRPLLESAQSQPAQPVLRRLLGELETVARSFVVVLDDYHTIDQRPVHELLAYLLEHLPPQMHLILATRADPPIPLARLRSRGELVELRAADLRFTLAESTTFINQAMGLDLRPEEISILEARTEGWIAGLQMAALALQDREDIPGFIQAFSGSHRFVLDYLAEEVLSSQPEHIRQFLLDTSILDRLCGPLCDAVMVADQKATLSTTATLGTTESLSPTEPLSATEEERATSLVPRLSSDILEYLDRSNLFLISLDDERRWYRYHHLFGELLRARLQQSAPERVQTLHLRASAWHDRYGFPAQAVEHAFAARDYELAAELIERHGQDRWSFSDVTFLGQIGRLPPEMLLERPRLGIYQAWVSTIFGRTDAAAALLDALARQLFENAGHPENQEMSSFVEMLQAYLAVQAGVPAQAVNLPGPGLLDFIPERHLGMRNSADIVYAMLLIWRGDFEPAAELLLKTVNRDIAAQGTTAIPIAISLLARLRLIQGRLHEAEALCRDYRALVETGGKWRFYIAGNLDILLGEVYREWNDLEGAGQFIQAGIEANTPWSTPLAQVLGFTALMRLQKSRRMYAEGLQTLQQVDQMLQGSTTQPDQASALRAVAVSLLLAVGDLASAADRAAAIHPEASFDFLNEQDHLTLARLNLAFGQPADALRRLEGIAPAAEAGGRNGRRIEIALLQALALASLGDQERALAALTTALRLAEPEKYVRLFLDEGEPVHDLLAAIRAQTGPAAAHTAGSNAAFPAYIDRLLEAFAAPTLRELARGQIGAAGLSAESDTGRLVEPLTPRELEVLRRVCAGDSNRAIAEKLFITLAAVKKHTGNIYGKLGVASRTQAIARARQLNLLGPEP